MDDLFKVFLYILVVVIYALLKMKKKDPAKQAKPPHQTPKTPLPHTAPTKSFADAPPKKAASLEQTIKRLDKEIKTSKEIIRPEKHIKSGKVYEEKSVQTLEKAKLEREPLSYESPARDYQSHFDKFETFSEIQNIEYASKDNELVFDYPEEEKLVNPYGEYLKDPENVKNAFVMKEIFDRKHF